MIVLDEQLMGYHQDTLISRWYRGKVVSLPTLRPATPGSLLRGFFLDAFLDVTIFLYQLVLMHLYVRENGVHRRPEPSRMAGQVI
jgi:hypothetical protein